MVGLEIIGDDWEKNIKKLSRAYNAQKGRLYSFEVKKTISRSDVRNSFFQAVSNSSWANYGYLVAAEINGRETINELNILAGLHGIGMIHLDRKNSLDSQILIQARYHDIDWDNTNRLEQENKDFRNYIIDVNSVYGNPDTKNKVVADWLK